MRRAIAVLVGGFDARVLPYIARDPCSMRLRDLAASLGIVLAWAAPGTRRQCVRTMRTAPGSRLAALRRSSTAASAAGHRRAPAAIVGLVGDYIPGSALT
jgi:hypothetical protein